MSTHPDYVMPWVTHGAESGSNLLTFWNQPNCEGSEVTGFMTTSRIHLKNKKPLSGKKNF